MIFRRLQCLYILKVFAQLTGPSLVCSLICFISFSNLRKKLPPKILLSLSWSLLALLIVFVAGAKRTSTRVGCQVVAGLLHYFILATFLWMGIEAASLYRFFIKVFKSGSEARFFVRASVVGWGKIFTLALHRKGCFTLRIFSVNMTKPAVSCRFDHICRRSS